MHSTSTARAQHGHRHRHRHSTGAYLAVGGELAVLCLAPRAEVAKRPEDRIVRRLPGPEPRDRDPTILNLEVGEPHWKQARHRGVGCWWRHGDLTPTQSSIKIKIKNSKAGRENNSNRAVLKRVREKRRKKEREHALLPGICAWKGPKERAM